MGASVFTPTIQMQKADRTIHSAGHLLRKPSASRPSSCFRSVANEFTNPDKGNLASLNRTVTLGSVPAYLPPHNNNLPKMR